MPWASSLAEEILGEFAEASDTGAILHDAFVQLDLDFQDPRALTREEQRDLERAKPELQRRDVWVARSREYLARLRASPERFARAKAKRNARERAKRAALAAARPPPPPKAPRVVPPVSREANRRYCAAYRAKRREAKAAEARRAAEAQLEAQRAKWRARAARKRALRQQVAA